MKLIVSGTRKFLGESVREVIFADLDYTHQTTPITEIVSGVAPGPDTFAIEWAKENGIPYKEFPAEWKKYKGRSAGPIRNEQMAKYGDRLLAYWDGRSPGTKNMITNALRKGMETNVTYWSNYENQ